MGFKICVVILLFSAALFSSADIYRCQAGDGSWLFTDRQCANAVGQKVKLSPTLTINKLKPTGLSEAERRALLILDRRMAKSRDYRNRQHKKNADQIKKNNKIKRQKCSLAVRQLADIQDKRSHGYKLSEAHVLDQRTRKLEVTKRTNCR